MKIITKIPVQATHTHPADFERCDRAYAERANYRITFPEGGVLTLCTHHFDEYQPNLVASGAKVEKI